MPKECDTEWYETVVSVREGDGTALAGSSLRGAAGAAQRLRYVNFFTGRATEAENAEGRFHTHS